MGTSNTDYFSTKQLENLCSTECQVSKQKVDILHFLLPFSDAVDDSGLPGGRI